MEPKGYVSTSYRVKLDSSGKVVEQTATSKYHRRESSSTTSLKALLNAMMRPRKVVKIQRKQKAPVGSLAELAKIGVSPRMRMSKRFSKSLVDLHSKPRAKDAVPESVNSSAQRLTSMISDCSSIQQSLMPLWKTACHNANSSLQMLETSRQALNKSAVMQITWKTSPKYVQKREALDQTLRSNKRNSQFRKYSILLGHSFAVPEADPRTKPTHAKANSDPVQSRVDEDKELLEEIREFNKKDIDLGDTFQRVVTPVVKKAAELPEELDTDALSDLNRFIFEKRNKLVSKSGKTLCQRHKELKATAMDCIEPSPEVLSKAKRLLLQREKQGLKATRVDNYKPMAFSKMISSWLVPHKNDEQRALLTDIQAEVSNSTRRNTLESMFRKSSIKKQIAAIA